MSPPTAFNTLLGPARHELELSIFQGIIDQSPLPCCATCKASLASLLAQVSQHHRLTPSLPTTQFDTLEIFSYDTKHKVITRHQLADSQPTNSFTRPTTTHLSVAKALYLDVQSSILPGIGAFPTWHKTILTKWVSTMRGLGGVEAGWWADRFLFEVLIFEYTHFFKVGDSKDLFVEMFVANDAPSKWTDESGEEVLDCIVVDTSEEHHSDDDDSDEEEDNNSDSDYDPSDDDEDVVMEDSDEGVSAPGPDANISTPVHTSLNEASCTILAQSYLSRANTFLLPTNQAGMVCQCPDYLDFKHRLTKSRRKPWTFEKVFRIMFLKLLGATDDMVYGGLEYNAISVTRSREAVVQSVVDDLAYALGHGDDEQWFGMFKTKFFAGKEVEEGKFADEVVVLESGPQWELDENGRLVRIR